MASRFRDALQKHPPTDYTDYRKWLKDLYTYQKTHADQYSYQKFSSDLGFGENFVTIDIIHGRRSVSLKAVQRICQRLNLKGTEAKYLKALIELNECKDELKTKDLSQKLIMIKSRIEPTIVDDKLLQYLSEWHNCILREMAKIDGIAGDANEISKKFMFQVRPMQVTRALQVLIENGYLKRGKDGLYEQIESNVSSGHRIKGLSLNIFHQQMMEKAISALTHVPGKERDISSMSVTVDGPAFEKVKSAIHDFQLKILAIADECAKPDQVCQLNIQMFPMTKKAKKDEE